MSRDEMVRKRTNDFVGVVIIGPCCVAALIFLSDERHANLSDFNTKPPHEFGRATPAKGVHLSSTGPNWVFLTVCTQHREPWLAETTIHKALHETWELTATAWLVSDYLLMPDHLHLFCAPQEMECSIERWIAFWKDRLIRRQLTTGSFQKGGFHHRLRDGESYAQKWNYVRENPVRCKLVDQPQAWLYQGRVHDIRW